jgi:DNA-binding CsgD family transcriptional regulator
LVTGYEPKRIAQRLQISLNTVRFHLLRAMDKTETSRQSDLVSLIIRVLDGRV